MRKARPLAFAAAALIAAPAAADPLPINVPTNPPPAPADARPNTPNAPAPAPAQPDNGALPQNLSIAEPPPPPPPPPAAPSPTPAARSSAPVADAPPARVTPAPTATVSVGLGDAYTRLSFSFLGPTSVTEARQGDRLELRFSRGADIDVADLRATPPRYVREVRKLSAAGAPVRLALTLEPGVRSRHFEDGQHVIVDLLPPAGGVTQNADGTTTPAPAAAPVSGNATVQLQETADNTQVTVHWPAPARAAIFRRGEAVWMLFDATGRIDLRGVQRAGRRHQDVAIVRGDGVIGLRIPVSPEIEASAHAQGSDWTVVLGAHADAGQAATVTRQVDADGKGRLIAAFGRDGVVRWISDPEVGDRIAVALVGGPAEGVDVRRATVEAEITPTAHGAVVEPRADGVTAAFDNGQLVVSRDGGGLLAQAVTAAMALGPANANAAPLAAGLSETDASDAPEAPTTPLRQVRDRIDDLERRAAAEGVMPGAPNAARMQLARYLLENDLAPEALGALRMAAINQEQQTELDPEFHLLRGEANVMLGRVADAKVDLNNVILLNDPLAALWRGYAATLKQDWSTARSELERGAGALEQLSPSWRARFQLALAQAALEMNDLAGADAAASAAMGQTPDPTLRLHARFVQARIMEARGDKDQALQVLDGLSHARDEEVAVRATLEAVRARLASGVMRPLDAVEPLEALRYRWRGDALELDIVSTLGEVYSETGRWRDALTTMRVAADRFGADPVSRRLRDNMSTLFERLFLDGEADKLEPIQALGLFYEFSELTPVGADGDRMVRLLAGRLVAVDLLDQAAQLLQHQVDERLTGIGKAQVAADLAAVYLMSAKPDKALVAIDTTRQPNMPTSLLAERRILEARALLDLGRLDNAVELVERDRSQDAQTVRAEAAWRAHDWERASGELLTLIGMHDHAKPLDEADRQVVLRAAIAMTLAGDDAGVRALYRAHAGDMAGTPDADDFEVVASGVSADGSALRDVARAVARTDLLDRFMQRLRADMTASAPEAQAPGAPAPPGAPPPAAPTTPAAAPPPQQQQRQAPAAATPTA